MSSAVNVELIEISDSAGDNTGTTALNIDASNNTNALALTGNDGDNTITGTSDANVIVAGGGADTIKSGAGADNITAGAGNDILVVSSAATDETGTSATYDGEGNTDTLIVAGGTNAVNFSNDTVQNIETLELTKQEDNTTADNNAQSLTMTDAQVDAISTINSADGDKVTLSNAMTSDMLDNSLINGVFEIVLSDNANDLTIADDSRMDDTNDRLEIDGSSSTGKLTFVGSNETTAEFSVTGGSIGDAITTGDGDDTIVGGSGVDTLVGGGGNDVFVYNSAAADATGTSEQITGGAGTADEIVVSGGTTSVDFSNDTLATIEILELTTDKDGTADNNDQTITLLDSQFNTLSAINANTGGSGASDKIILNDVATSDMLTNGTNTVINGTLTLQLKNVASNALTLADANMDATGDLLIVDGSSLTGVNALTFDGSLETNAEMSITGGAAADTIKSGGGDDTIDAGAGTDSIDAGGGNDFVFFDTNAELAGDVTVIGGSGTDTIQLETGSSNLTIDESSFGDLDGFENLVFNGTGIHTVDFASDIDGAYANGITITINTSAASINISRFNANISINATGTNNNDTLLGGTVNDVLNGGSGHDSIDGAAGNDTIDGGAGNDTIIGNAGDDRITLGDGSNVLVFNSSSGTDTIVDYEEGDAIQLDNSKLLGAVSNFSDGSLNSSAFQTGTSDTASSSDVRVIYNTTNNKLFFDADGNAGGSAAIELATFSSDVDSILDAAEFTVI